VRWFSNFDPHHADISPESITNAYTPEIRELEKFIFSGRASGVYEGSRTFEAFQRSPRLQKRSDDPETRGWGAKERASQKSTGIIYMFVNKRNGKKYIGQSRVSFRRRMQGHKSKAKQNKDKGCRALNAAIRKYGWDAFDKIVICEVPIEELSSKEQEMIAMHNSLAPNGYNLTPGGESSPMLNESVKETARKVMNSSEVRLKRQKVFSSDEFKTKVSVASSSSWHGTTTDEKVKRRVIMAAGNRRNRAAIREAKIESMSERAGRKYWQSLKQKAQSYARRVLKSKPQENYEGRDLFAEVEMEYGASFEERKMGLPQQ